MKTRIPSFVLRAALVAIAATTAACGGSALPPPHTLPISVLSEAQDE